ncbi:MAG: NAD(P)/FAD-dependent oxidoreductase [Desulfobacterales bacterium]
MNDTPIVVLGAGPAGLAAAYELSGKGIHPVVLEKGDKVGGIARTETYLGYHFDIGGHRFFTKVERINRLWHEMMGDDFLKVPRISRIYYKGRFYDYPLRVFNTFFNLGLLESLLILTSYFKTQLLPHTEEVNFEQWVSNRFGNRLFTTFFKTYTEKVWGIPCYQISSEWAAQRIKGLSLVAALSNSLLGTQNAKSLISTFNYPLKGPGMMWQRFREAIEANGGEVRLDSEAVCLRHDNGRIVSVLYKRNGETAEIPSEHVISSIPITRLADMLDPGPPDNVLEAAKKLSYRAFIIVMLILDKKDLFPDQWIYIHSPEVKVGRIQNFKNWSGAMVPDSEKTSIGMEYFCNVGDETWKKPDTELADMAARELAELGLAEAGDVTDNLVVRQPYAYPVYDRDYDRHLRVVRDYLETIDNLQTVGRNGMHRYNNMDHSMQTGIMAAQNVMGANYDLWRINEENEYIEEDKEKQKWRILVKNTLVPAFNRMDKLAFATALGSVAGLLFFIATAWTLIKGDGVLDPYILLFSQYFIGYTLTLKGAFIAFGYSFTWGFLAGWLFAYLRNLLFASYIYWIKRKSEVLTLFDFFDHF